jgi:predicted phosphate transport protein (TIGR00153 family)
MRLALFQREQRFFDYFDEVAELLVQAADVFAELVGAHVGHEDGAVQMRELEHQCDMAVANVLTMLARSFITPMDRDDIHNLATSLDTIMDNMEETSYRFAAYRMGRPSEAAIELAEVVRRSVLHVQRAVNLCRGGLSSADMETVLRDIGRLENDGDEIFRNALASLFADPPETLELIKWKDLYQWLENTVDACRASAHVISEIVVKGT